MGDVNVLDMLAFEAGAFYVMDRGYLDFTRLHRLHQAGAFFVTRASAAWTRGACSNTVDRSTGDLRSARDAHRLLPVRNSPSICGASIQGPRVGQDAGLPDQQHGLPALTICALYKSRWQVELFFKGSSASAVKHFLGNSENAVRPGVVRRRHLCSSPSSERLQLEPRDHVYRSCRCPCSRTQPAPSRPRVHNRITRRPTVCQL